MAIKIARVQTDDRLINQIQQNIAGVVEPAINALQESYPVDQLTGLGTGVETFLVTPSSANLKAALTDETGSGAAVFATSPTLVTPILGVAAATSVNFGGGALDTFIPWTTWTPTVTNNTGTTVITQTSLVARYSQVGKIVFMELDFVFSTSNSGTAATLKFNLPVSPKSTFTMFASYAANPGDVTVRTNWTVATLNVTQAGNSFPINTSGQEFSIRTSYEAA